MVKPTTPCQLSFTALPSSSKTYQSRKQKKRKGKRKEKKKRKERKEHLDTHKFNHTMFAWAQNFTAAATWQIKHELAFWKAKATALEYENKVLHEIIQKNYHVHPRESNFINRSNEESDNCDEGNEEHEGDKEHEDDEHEGDESEDEFEASEELVQFLAANAKYREAARLERERLKAKLAKEEEEEEEDQLMETSDDREEKAKKLYGDKWQSVMALETSILTNFMIESDKSKPSFWPNIPFNFNYPN